MDLFSGPIDEVLQYFFLPICAARQLCVLTWLKKILDCFDNEGQTETFSLHFEKTSDIIKFPCLDHICNCSKVVFKITFKHFQRWFQIGWMLDKQYERKSNLQITGLYEMLLYYLQNPLSRNSFYYIIKSVMWYHRIFCDIANSILWRHKIYFMISQTRFFPFYYFDIIKYRCVYKYELVTYQIEIVISQNQFCDIIKWVRSWYITKF